MIGDLNSLEKASSKVFDSFSNNQRKANPGKCYLLTSATTSLATKIKDNETLNRESKKKLYFNNHSQKILKKTNQKNCILARITPYMIIFK